jgi:peroxiredoxin
MNLRISAIALLFAFAAGSAPAQAVVGSPAPDFTLPDTRGTEHSLADFAGKIVVLEWTNVDCPFVKKHYSVGNMQALQAKYAAQDVVWLSVCSSAPGKQGHYQADAWTPILDANGSKAAAVLLDPDGTVGKAYGARTTPHLFVIDSQGILAYDGAIDDKPSTNSDDVPGARSYLSEALDALLDAQPVPTPKTPPYGCSVKY